MKAHRPMREAACKAGQPDSVASMAFRAPLSPMWSRRAHDLSRAFPRTTFIRLRSPLREPGLQSVVHDGLLPPRYETAGAAFLPDTFSPISARTSYRRAHYRNVSGGASLNALPSVFPLHRACHVCQTDRPEYGWPHSFRGSQHRFLPGESGSRSGPVQ